MSEVKHMGVDESDECDLVASLVGAFFRHTSGD